MPDIAPADRPGFGYLFDAATEVLESTPSVVVRGRVLQVVGTIIRATALGARVGDLVMLRNPDDGHELAAEVVGLQGDAAILTPLGDTRGVSTLTEVLRRQKRRAGRMSITSALTRI